MHAVSIGFYATVCRFRVLELESGSVEPIVVCHAEVPCAKEEASPVLQVVSKLPQLQS